MNGLIQPPIDPLLSAIPLEVRDAWRKKPTTELIRRLEFLCACGPKPSDDIKAMYLMHSRAVRAVWETYIYCAFACGLFEGQRGDDFRGRFASKNEADFRSAMAECLACWFLSGKLGLPVSGNAPGRGAKMLDMKTVINCREVGVEVKAPYREAPPDGKAFFGHDGDLLAQCLATANKQFNDTVANILIIVPELRIPVSQFRVQLVSALYGENKIVCPIDTRTGGQAGPVATKFFPEGKLLRRQQPSGALVKPDGTPGFTRISAVVVIEEKMRIKYPSPDPFLLSDEKTRHEIWLLYEQARVLWMSHDNEAWIDHNILVAHNPYAQYPINIDVFSGYVQFMNLGTGYGWSDGERL